MKKYAGEEFLNRLYKDLVHSDEVKHTAKGANKNEDLAIYLERLERITNEARDKDRLELLKYFYYKKYVIKEEDVPESYFEHQEQIALERGYGHITYNEETKKQEIDLIISEQRESLDRWLEYFVSEDTKHYPMWFKYYVFQNIMKIGDFDKGKNEYTKRTDSTVKPFIEINREAVSMLYDELCKYLNKVEITDETLELLIKNGSFNKIYSYIKIKLDEAKKTKSTSNEGIWKKYEQGSNPEILFNDIHGKGTGWCTAGGIETATAHLNGGDFHVYYTKDEKGEYTNPRIAIRMEYHKIAEIRGIAEHQNLEDEMETVVEEKLTEFPDKEEYKKKVSDMKELTKIYNKHKDNEELTKEELRFLYEIDSYILNFGYGDDPRVKEIKTVRSLKKDLPFIFDLKFEEISRNAIDALKRKVHYGDLDCSFFLKSFDGVVLPEEVIGSLKLNNLITAKGVIMPKRVRDNFILNNLISSEGLIFPEYIGGDIEISRLKHANELKFPEEINGDLNLSGLTSAEELILPQKIGETLDLSGLTSAEELILPQKIGRTLDLSGLTNAKGLVLPEVISYSLLLDGLIDVKELNLPRIINGSLSLDGLTNAKGLIFPKEIVGSLYLQSLKVAEGIILPKNEKGEYYVPCVELICPFTKEQLIEEAKRTELNQNDIKIFGDHLIVEGGNKWGKK